MTQPLEYENLAYGKDEVYGKTSSEKVGFWGATPVARLTASTNLVSTVTGISTSTVASAVTTWGWASQAEFNNFNTAVSTMQFAMKQLGLMAGGVQTAVTASSQVSVKDYGSPDGAQYGHRSSETIGFYGVTPVSKLGTVTVNISSVATVSGSTAAATLPLFGFGTSSQFTMVNNAVSSMQAAMKLVGLIA